MPNIQNFRIPRSDIGVGGVCSAIRRAAAGRTYPGMGAFLPSPLRDVRVAMLCVCLG